MKMSNIVILYACLKGAKLHTIQPEKNLYAFKTVKIKMENSFGEFTARCKICTGI